ncbi:DNA polymerase III subunit gamma and tau [Sinomonas atrocyanea]|uniref:DNA polymerase III subunit gamma and tau n=1 Tax=Sinomonas atrocyanea TaxID=37927 RepID=UPI003D972066
MTAPAALYRRYRPDTFKDVIGQEHVTEPLMTALRKDRISHAYLFSGPRGCGKTTSARILARCLNCEKGPTPDPCGVCPSCIELARGGAGSLDVIEIDAASHGGVDDARDLRERATFAPVRDRYKIFIIDEAHMVTSAGFNALLKIVEEPPEHIKFIFATTEPDKVIGTIRSRTHHYPFRLVPPEPLLAYLEQLCAAENVTVAPGVLSLVIRAGGGSVRDSLSVLDQLMAGAGTDGIDYELAVALLGYTHAALLDDVVDAMAAGDSGTVFRAVDRVIQTGHDPRRFVEDLLERFRDLIIVQALPDAAESILRGVPADQLARMRVQGQNLGAAELSRAADVTNEAFNEMTGATSPRLHLELLCARLMLPAADANERGWAARVDRLERRLSFAHDGAEPAHAAHVPAAPAPAAAAPAAPSPAAAPRGADGQSVPAVPERNQRQPEPRPVAPVAERPTPVAAEPRGTEPTPSSSGPNRVTSAPQEVTSAPQGVTSAPHGVTSAPHGVTSAPHGVTSAQGGGAGSVEMVRRAWPEILDALAKVKRSTWALVGPNASVAGYDGRTLALAFGTSGLASAFTRGDHSENLRRAIQDVIGVDCQIDAVTGGNGPGNAPTAGGDQRPKAPADPPPGTSVPEPGIPAPAQGPSAQAPRAQAAAPHATAGRAAQPEAAPAPAPSAAAPSAADIAWGLAPAPSPAPTAEPTGAARASEPSRPSARSASSVAPAPPAPSSAGTDAGQPAAPAAQPSVAGAGRPAGSPPPEPARAAAPAPAPSAQSTPARRPAAEPAPYDDIPYSDEEPPSDWDAPYPDDEGYAPSRPRSAAANAPAPSAPGAAGTAVPGPSQTSAGDPWSYATETSPGVWTVGTEPNLRSSGAQAAAEARPTAEPDPAPSYAPAAAQPPQASPAPASPAPAPSAQSGRGDGGRKLSMYERLSRSAAAQQSVQQQSAQQPSAQSAPQYVEEIPSADDETIEGSSLFGRAAVERILGGKLIEERSLDGAPLPPR